MGIRAAIEDKVELWNVDSQNEIDQQDKPQSEAKMQDKTEMQGKMDSQDEINLQDKIESQEMQNEIEIQNKLEDIMEAYVVEENNDSDSNSNKFIGEDQIVDAPMDINQILNTNEMDQYLEKGNIIVKTSEIIKKINILIVRTLNIIIGLYIKEIVYKSNGYWKLRNINLDYLHLCKYSTLIALSPKYSYLQILKLFINVYCNDFGKYWNVYYFLDGFVPFGESFNDFICPFVSDMKQLERGILINIQGSNYWVIASLGCTIVDLPQGNNLVDVKRYGATRGCRTCLVSRKNAMDENPIGRLSFLL
ncbi:34352_t:CDS:2, partial [Gigaspora margarita]